jgi:hypothetical protein
METLNDFFTQSATIVLQSLGSAVSCRRAGGSVVQGLTANISDRRTQRDDDGLERSVLELGFEAAEFTPQDGDVYTVEGVEYIRQPGNRQAGGIVFVTAAADERAWRAREGFVRKN